MSVDATRQIRGYLVSNATITNYVPTADIRIGWPKEEDNYPCITISKVTGIDYGYLGYNTAAAGTKIRREEPTFQIDTWSKNSLYSSNVIADEITKVMISGGCRKNSENDMYDDDMGIYRVIQSFTYVKFHSD